MIASRHLARALVLLSMILAWLTVPCYAHESRPGSLELKEAAGGLVDVTWKCPINAGRRERIEPVFPEHWTQVTTRSSERVGVAFIERWKLKPGETGLQGSKIIIDGLPSTPVDVLVRASSADGRSITKVLRPNSPSFQIQFAEGEQAVFTWDFFIRGIDHILLGVDHLLFVLGLLLIVNDRWSLVKTVTAFTVAHSITLALATLGLASVPIEPLNACIALSILFLGPEIVRTWRGQTSLTIQYPWVVAFLFGLLHGFGFASGLSTTGLPPGEMVAALLLFNLGVEAGQLGFVLLVLALLWAFRKLQITWPKWVTKIPGLSIGALGGYWTVQRTILLFS